MYRLNASLTRLGLPPVQQLPQEIAGRSLEDIWRFAFTLIDQDLFPAPAWLLPFETLDSRDVEHARLIAEEHYDAVHALETVVEKVNYLQGRLDHIFMEEQMKRGELVLEG